MWVPWAKAAGVIGSVYLSQVHTTSTDRISFVLPDKLLTLDKCDLVGMWTGGGTTFGWNLLSRYCAEDGDYLGAAETLNSVLTDVLVQTAFQVDMLPVLTGAVAGDRCGVQFDPQGTASCYLMGVHLEWS